MLRALGTFGKMFSSSQAQPVKDETDSDHQDDRKEEPTNQFKPANSSGVDHTEIHNYDLQDDATGADREAEHTTKPNNEKGKANHKLKRGKADGKLRAKKAATQKSQVQEELLKEFGEDEREDFDAGDESRHKEVSASINVLSSSTGKKKAKSKRNIISDNNEPSAVRRSTRKTTPAIENNDSEGEHPVSKRRAARKSAPAPEIIQSIVTSESEYEAPTPRWTHTESALGNVEPAAEEPTLPPVASKPLRPRKANGDTKNANQKNAPLPEITEDLVAEDEDEHDVSIEDLVRQSRHDKKATGTTKQPKPRAKKVVRSAITVEESEVEASEPLSKKAKKAKRTPKEASKPILDELADDDEESVAPSQQPLTPAPVHNGMSSVLEDRIDVDAQFQDNALSSAPNAATASPLPDSEIENNDTPKRPSKKALGKRIATETAPESRKRQRKSKGNSTDTPPLAKFGFTSHSAGPFVNNFDEDEEDFDNIATNVVKGAQPSQVTSSARRPTPAFTPINRAMAPAPSQTPVLTPSRLSIVLPGRRASDVAKTTPLKQVKDLSGAESEAEREYELPAPEPSRSNEKRKRRLSTGDSESSKTSATSPQKRAVSGTPKQSAVSKASKVVVTPARKTAAEGPAKKGRFSKEELAELREHVETWRAANDMSHHDLNAMVQRKPASKEFKPLIDYVSGQMPERERQAIIETLRRQFHNYENRGGKWTPEEDAELKKAFELYPRQWRKIAARLDRYHGDVRDRYRDYVEKGHNQKKGTWTKGEEDSLMAIVAEMLEGIREQREPSDNPHNPAKDDVALVDFTIVSSKMDPPRTRLQCLQKYSRLRLRFESASNDPVATTPVGESKWRLEKAENDSRGMTTHQKLQMLYKIRDSKAGSEDKIPWAIIQTNPVKNQNERMAFKMCLRKLRVQVPGHEEMELQAVVDTLIDAFEVAAPDEPDRYLMGFGGKKRAKEGNGELSSAKKRKFSAPTPNAAFLEDESDDDPADNGGGFSTKPKLKRLSITKGKKPGLIQRANPSENSPFTKTQTPAPAPIKKTKLHERMRQQDQSTGHETNATTVTDEDRAASEDMVSTRSMKVAKPQAKRVAKKPINKAKTTQPKKATAKKATTAQPKRSLPKPISAERITASDDEMDRDGEEHLDAAGGDTVHTEPQPAIEAEPEDEGIPEHAMELAPDVEPTATVKSREEELREQQALRDEMNRDNPEVYARYLRSRLSLTPPPAPSPGFLSEVTSISGPDGRNTEVANMADFDDENEITMMTHDQVSVDLDSTQAESISEHHFDPADYTSNSSGNYSARKAGTYVEPTPSNALNAYSDESDELPEDLADYTSTSLGNYVSDDEPRADPPLDDVHPYGHRSNDLPEDPANDDEEQHGHRAGSQTWNAYGTALQYNRDLSQAPAHVSAQAPAAQPSPSSYASTIHQRPKLVVSREPKAWDHSDITSSSDEFKYAEFGVPKPMSDEEDEWQPAHRRRAKARRERRTAAAANTNTNNGRSSGRQASVEL